MLKPNPLLLSNLRRVHLPMTVLSAALLAAGCAQLELSSSLKREAAHRFYLAQDYQERPKRFVKLL